MVMRGVVCKSWNCKGDVQYRSIDKIVKLANLFPVLVVRPRWGMSFNLLIKIRRFLQLCTSQCYINIFVLSSNASIAAGWELWSTPSSSDVIVQFQYLFDGSMRFPVHVWKNSLPKSSSSFPLEAEITKSSRLSAVMMNCDCVVSKRLLLCSF